MDSVIAIKITAGDETEHGGFNFNLSMSTGISFENWGKLGIVLLYKSLFLQG